MTDAQRHAAETASTPAATPSASPPLADVIAKPPRSSGRGGSLLLGLAAVVAVGGIAFAAGRLTAPAATATGFPGAGRLPGNGQAGDGQLPGSGQIPADGTGFPGRGGFGGLSLQGTVTEVTAEAITIELDSGTTVTIPVDQETAYRTASVATAAAVQVGREVAITPGARTIDPSASFDPGAAPGAGGGAGAAGGMTFGAASTVTVLEP